LIAEERDLIVVFSGSIGRCAVGGLAWMNMQYLAGLRALGHEVYYLEECGPESWVYDWEAERLTTDLAYPTGYIRDCLGPLGLAGRWAYRAGDQCAGMATDEIQDVCAKADLMIIHAVPLAQWREEYERPRRRAFIDVDPGFTQISLAKTDAELAATVERCDRLFTIGQRIGAADCPIPTAGREWLKTLPPVALPLWPVAENGPATHFTTVMQWRGFRDVSYDGVLYGQKDREFPVFMDLPRQTSQPFRIALTGAAPDDLTRHGWEVVPGHVPSRTPWSYQNFIQSSRAEFTVAKHGYVRMRGGWFSDRSVCYLAAGRPVLVEDTGLADWLPVGEGVVTFRDVPEALSGVSSINGNYESHCRTARRLAEDVFAADRVLPSLLAAATD
jgi:hypothetical protein